MLACSVTTLRMRFCQCFDRRGNTERNQKVLRSFLTSRTSIGISDSAPSAASASAAGSDRFTARAKSQSVENDVGASGAFETIAGASATAPATDTTSGVGAISTFDDA